MTSSPLKERSAPPVLADADADAAAEPAEAPAEDVFDAALEDAAAAPDDAAPERDAVAEDDAEVEEDVEEELLDPVEVTPANVYPSFCHERPLGTCHPLPNAPVT